MSQAILLKAKDFQNSPQEMDLRGLLDSLQSVDWIQGMIARGYGWHFDVGSFLTPIVGGGNGTVFDQDQPEFAIAIPSGYVCVPFRVDINCKTPLIAADADISEILLAADVAALAAGLNATNGTMETPTNMRTNISSACPFTVASALTMNITNPTLGVELAREVITGDVQGTAANALWGRLKMLYEPKRQPFIVGPAGLYGYWGGTVATSGYGSIEFLAFRSDLLLGLV